MTVQTALLSEKSWPSRSQASDPVGSTSAQPDAPAFAELLDRLGSELDRGERLIDRAASGAPVNDASTLIALQAGIYRYTETVDLAAKLVDGATNAARTTLQSGH